MTEYTVTGCTYRGQKVDYTQDAQGLRVRLPEGIKGEPDTIIRLETGRPVQIAEDAEIYFTGK